MKQDSSKAVCVCGKMARKVYQPPALKTDTSFCLTGKYHLGVSESPNDLIEGRADWNRRLKEKNLRELDKSEIVNPKMPTPQPLNWE